MVIVGSYVGGASVISGTYLVVEEFVVVSCVLLRQVLGLGWVWGIVSSARRMQSVCGLEVGACVGVSELSWW